MFNLPELAETLARPLLPPAVAFFHLGGLPGGTGVAKECDELDNVAIISLAGFCP